jgi:preprotein translocase subunit YajC
MADTQATTEVPAAPPQQPGLLGTLTPITLMVLVFYFLIMRPQQKREAQRRNLIASVKKGDRVVTASGIIGTLHKIIGEKEISLEVAENVRIRVLKNSVTEVLGKGTASPESEDESDKKADQSSEPPSEQNKRKQK